MEVTPKDVVRRLYELLNPRKFEDVPGLFSPHWAGHGIGEQGVQDLVEEFRGFATGFPDLTCSPFDLIAEGDKVVALVVNRGTHTEEFMGHPLTGVRSRSGRSTSTASWTVGSPSRGAYSTNGECSCSSGWLRSRRSTERKSSGPAEVRPETSRIARLRAAPARLPLSLLLEGRPTG